MNPLSSSRSRRFLKQLRPELGRWLQDGLITVEQHQRILDSYQDPGSPGRSPRRVSSILPAIMISLAVVLIGVGMFLFYAANWRAMLPGVKLAQVFGIVVGAYGGSYYLLFRRKMPLAGRGLLLLGMVAFGAAIALISQIFHISAHPSNGVLVWMIGVLLLSAVMEEQLGYYLGAALALVWNLWEISVYGSPNYFFVLVPLVLGFLFHAKQNRAGLVGCALALLMWFYQVNIELVSRVAEASEAHIYALILLHLPLGLVLVAASRFAARDLFTPARAVMGAIGWCFLFLTLLGLSWPMELSALFPLLVSHPALWIQFLLLLCTAAVLIVSRLRHQPGSWLLWSGLLCAALVFVLPMGQRQVGLIVTHLTLLALLLGLLYHGHRHGGRLVRVLAFVFSIAALVVKGLGLLIMAASKPSYFAAYCIGYVMFATVVFLINQTVHHQLGAVAPPAGSVPAASGAPARYRVALLDGMCALSVFLILFALSFHFEQQQTIFTAGAAVLLLVGLFISLALGFYWWLWRRGSPRLPLVISAIIFTACTAVMAMANPGLPWQFYSVVFNLLLLMVEGALLFYAVRVNSTALANLVIGGFTLQIFTRYFDLFWDLLSGSLLFIITGLVIFGGGFFLELNRRKVVRMIDKETEAER